MNQQNDSSLEMSSVELPTSLMSVDDSLSKSVSIVEPAAKINSSTPSPKEKRTRSSVSPKRGGSSISRSPSSVRLKRSKSVVAEIVPNSSDHFVYANCGPTPSTIETKDLSDGRTVVVRTWKLRDGAHIQLITDFIPPQECESALEEMIKWPHWIHGQYKIYGKDCNVQRLAACCSTLPEDQIFKYRMKKELQSQPDCITKIQKSVENYTKKRMAYADLNYYRNGDDHFYLHQDKHVITGDIVVGVSLGQGRKMLFQHSEDKNSQLALYLPSGSLIIQSERSQLLWKHGIPKAKMIENPRVNITFRQA